MNTFVTNIKEHTWQCSSYVYEQNNQLPFFYLEKKNQVDSKWRCIGTVSVTAPSCVATTRRRQDCTWSASDGPGWMYPDHHSRSILQTRNKSQSRCCTRRRSLRAPSPTDRTVSGERISRPKCGKLWRWNKVWISRGEDEMK